MSLLGGDLTTPARYAQWFGSSAPSSPAVAQMVTSMSQMIYSKLSRQRVYSQQFVRTLDGVGNYQLVLPDWPVTSISKLQVGSALIQPFPLPSPTTGFVPTNTFGYGYRFVSWDGDLPGQPAVIEFVGGAFPYGKQNVQVTYQAGYLIANEAQTVPGTPFQVTVQQPYGIWSRDNGVVYAATGVALVPVTGTPSVGQYKPPPDTTPGLYTFAATDAAANLLISYSFIPADLEEACNQMVAERLSYRSRIGEESKSLGGQETVRFMRGGNRYGMFPDLPPEVESLISPYVSVIPPAIGAPV